MMDELGSRKRHRATKAQVNAAKVYVNASTTNEVLAEVSRIYGVSLATLKRWRSTCVKSCLQEQQLLRKHSAAAAAAAAAVVNVPPVQCPGIGLGLGQAVREGEGFFNQRPQHPAGMQLGLGLGFAPATGTPDLGFPTVWGTGYMGDSKGAIPAAVDLGGAGFRFTSGEPLAMAEQTPLRLHCFVPEEKVVRERECQMGNTAVNLVTMPTGEMQQHRPSIIIEDAQSCVHDGNEERCRRGEREVVSGFKPECYGDGSGSIILEGDMYCTYDEVCKDEGSGVADESRVEDTSTVRKRRWSSRGAAGFDDGRF
ncbi:hypothetical protein CBR_g39212 [Chara braunii]|uniref:Uncharacterized protein n=1 Tax=Chara braunii TaxID=69332 RepID=A0A388LR97_CHABU|nr:hypothetical protein CBR_g39212 [Chara braunii]|eukprot:GBG84837.1 hypothetical protein CBR_g39212 [Chara braunii]